MKTNNIKLELKKLKLKLSSEYKKQNDTILTIQQDIKNLEIKINNETLEKIEVNNKITTFNEIITRQDKSIANFGLYLTVSGILVAIIIVLLGVKNEGTARNVASEEMEKWINKKADKEFASIIEKHKKGLDRVLFDAKKSAKNINNMEKISKSHFNNLKINPSKIEKKAIAKKRNELINSNKNLSINDLKTLFLFAYYDKKYDYAIKYSKKLILKMMMLILIWELFTVRKKNITTQ